MLNSYGVQESGGSTSLPRAAAIALHGVIHIARLRCAETTRDIFRRAEGNRSNPSREGLQRHPTAHRLPRSTKRRGRVILPYEASKARSIAESPTACAGFAGGKPARPKNKNKNFNAFALPTSHLTPLTSSTAYQSATN